MPLPRKDKAPIVVPPSIRRRAGFKPSDKLEFKASGGVITITAKPETADDEYTPAQRRVIDAGIREGLEQFKRGEVFGPFDSASEMMASIEAEIKKRRVAKRKKRTG
jgi:bifunctional DNA-binding transcriptional regulator/antitoxin component of YhaV-PrlF toxin-antitoxin module